MLCSGVKLADKDGCWWWHLMKDNHNTLIKSGESVGTLKNKIKTSYTILI
jgi:hypothetical protein